MVSVCMASYNGEKYIKDQIDSILTQISPDDELIISDDGSTDGTLDIIKSYGDPRIKLLNHEGPKGSTPNSINALMASRGDYIFLADQDDFWLPGKYKKMMAAIEGYDFVHHDSIVVDDDSNTLYDSLYSLKHNGPGLVKNMIKGSFYGSHMLITRKLLNLAVPFPENIEVGHDLWIGLVATMSVKMNYIPDKLIYYRRHEGAHCELFEASKRPLKTKIYGRLVMLKYILGFKLKTPPSL